MWVPTQDEAVLMYARFLKAHHGVAASKLARKKAGTLQDDVDLAGYRIWNDVAEDVDRPAVWPQPRLLVRDRDANDAATPAFGTKRTCLDAADRR